MPKINPSTQFIPTQSGFRTRNQKRKSVQLKPALPVVQTPVAATSTSYLNMFKGGMWKKLAVVVLTVVIAGYLIRNNKGWFLAATVNGIPITKSELNTRLNSRFGKQILDALIGEKIILAEAAQKNLTASEQEIDEQLKELEKNLGPNTSLDDFLKLQSMSKNDLIDRIRMQTLINKMFSKESSVSAEEIDQYIASNSALMTATESSVRKEQASKEIQTTKVGKAFFEWFNKKRSEAQVVNY